jgi:hypothetical protein
MKAEKALLIIEKIAEKLGTTSKYLLEVLTKQAKINAITTLIQMLFVVLIGIGVFFYMLWQINLAYSHYSKIDELFGWYIGFGIADFIGVIIYVCEAYTVIYNGIDECIKCWKNPEGCAIEDILDRF